ncbi:MAG: hypothetical protein PHN16_02835 [Candidatus Omnitrophica bacterium]|jgi:signal transduction histidine kinase|nr:hypothetical protein [Candidatus Omnitrophota bacterium]
MEIKQFTGKVRSDFNRLISLTGIIPLLVFIYLIAVKISTFEAFSGQAGYITAATIGVFTMGIIVGRKMLVSVIIKLIDDNQKILSMQRELIEKSRLAAITETVLALGDQINNPLLTASGNLELLSLELGDPKEYGRAADRVKTVRESLQRILRVTEKMSKLTRPELATVAGDIRMIDPDKSE